MQRLLVMTIIGPDWPGLVDSVASLIAEHCGNWLESRMARLGGQFAGILRVEIPAQKEQLLISALGQLQKQGIRIVVHGDESNSVSQAVRLSLLDIVGQDRPGIVRQISHALASYGVNVEELQTECESAAMSGETLFRARAKLSIPRSCSVDEIRQQLERIAEDLIVEISFAELPATEPTKR
jgi:glycine cleavage system regulatory protein